MEEEIVMRLAASERARKRLTMAVVLLGIVAVGGLVSGFSSQRPEAREVLRAKELLIEDANGVVRVRVAGNLPNAVIDGREVPRGGEAAGVLVYDSTGQERGGYVTFNSGNVVLTLDSRASQTAYFVASASGATALRLWHDDDAVELRADADGARLTAVRDDNVVLQIPEVASPVGTEACAGYREALSRVDEGEVMAACRRRMSLEFCRACISKP